MTTQRPTIPPSRRRFLTFAAVGSAVAAASLALAATPASVPQASLELRARIRQLEEARARLTIAQADYEEADAMLTDWIAEHPKPASKKGTRRWIRKLGEYERATTMAVWQTLLDAEQAFERDQHALAAVTITGPADIAALAAASIIFDVVELHTNNRAPIARGIAAHVFKLGKAVLA